MTDTRPAWVMDVGDGVTVAAGTAHVAEYLVAAEPIPLPRTPAHCAGVMVWRDRLIPVIDLARLLTGRRSPPGPHRRAVILAYQEAAGRPLQYGALYVAGAPTRTAVSDDMACALPDAQPALPHLARACFSYRDKAVAILDPGALFARALPAALEPREESGPADAGPPDSARVISVDELAERRRGRAAPDAVPAARGAATAAAPGEPDRTLPAGHGGDERTGPAPDALAAAASIDVDRPDATDAVAEPAADLPALEDAPRTADVATATVMPARAGAASPRRGASNAARSFERLHAIERRHRFAGRRGWLWLLAAAAAALLLIGLWHLGGPDDTAAPNADAPQPAAMVRDPASLDVRPASVPSTPAQPPN